MSENNGLDVSSPANIYTIQQTLSGHMGSVIALAWSPNGQYLSSSSLDGTICVWDGKTGLLLHNISGFMVPIWNMIWSPDGQCLALSSLDGNIHLWDGRTGIMLQLFYKDASLAWSLAWSPDGQSLASGSLDHMVRIWNTQTGNLLHTLSGHIEPVVTVAWSPDGQYLASGSLDSTVRVWRPETGDAFVLKTIDTKIVKSLSWSLDKHVLTSISLDNVVESWDMETGQEEVPAGLNVEANAFSWSWDGRMIAFNTPGNVLGLFDLERRHGDILEGQTGRARLLSFSSDGQFLASVTLSDSKQPQGAIYIWRKSANAWVLESTIQKVSDEAHIAFHPHAEAIAIADKDTYTISILRRDEPSYSIDDILADAVHYKNAKVVLVGDSGVGKTGLAFVLAGKPYEKTDSTHGRHIWVLDEEGKFYHDAQSIEIQEILLWDLAGQPGYRLVHQLHLDAVIIALVVFDARSDTNPFAGVVYWERALRQANKIRGTITLPPLKKFLVEARIDRGGVAVSTGRIDTLMREYSFDAFFKTSAKENIRIDELKTAIKKAIIWEELPGVNSTRLIQTIKGFLIEQKTTGRLLDTIDTLYQTFLMRKDAFSKKEDLYLHFSRCIDRLESMGLIKQLSFGSMILLQPEILDAYASALINAVREEPEGFGIITEERVRKGDFFMSEEERLADKGQEKLLLIALIEDLLHRELVLREEPFLVFPSQSTREYSDLPELGQKIITFTFDGSVQNIYVTLVVRLANSGTFRRNGLWNNAVTYTASVGGECGILLQMDDDGHGELLLFFDEAANEQTRFLFEEYIYSHLKNKVLPEALKRRRNFFCHKCSTPITEMQVQGRVARGHDWISCNVCDERNSLLDRERRIGTVPSQLIHVLDNTADRQRNQEMLKLSLEGKRVSNSFDVFLWCSYEDKPAVKKCGGLLKEQGILPWFEDWEIQPGLPRQSEIEKYLKQARTAAVFFGKGGIKAWVRLLEQAFVREFVECERPLIPIILPEATEITLPDLPAIFQNMQWVDFRQGDPDPFEQLIWGITGKRPDL